MITINKTVDLNKVLKKVQDHGGSHDSGNSPIPLGDTELVIQVEGPADLDVVLKSVPEIINVYPDSEMQLY